MSEKDKTWPAAKEFGKCLYSIKTPSNEKMNELAKLAVKNAKVNVASAKLFPVSRVGSFQLNAQCTPFLVSL